MNKQIVICQNCGIENNSEYDFCCKCGTLIDKVTHKKKISQDIEKAIELLKEKINGLKCSICGSKIIWFTKNYNDLIGKDVLLLKCENEHEESIELLEVENYS